MTYPVTPPADSATAPAPERKPHVVARECFTLCEEAYRNQRERELADLTFIDQAGGQWPEDIRRSRNGQPGGGGLPPVPARPCLEFNLLRGPVQQVINTARQAKLGLSFAPEGEGATQVVAQAYDDIARAIQADSRAHLARQWAFERAAKCGFGAYRILTEYVDGKSFDQKIVYKRILNQAALFLDPFAQEPDWSDGRYALLTQDVPLGRYREQYPDSRLASYSATELTSVGNDVPGWIRSGDGDAGSSIRVAEYWEVREATRTLLQLPDGSSAYEDDIPTDILATVEQERGAPLLRRTITTSRTVFWSLVNGYETLLPPQEWNGSFIPFVPVIGDEANINGDRRWSGLVQFARDAQRSYNYMRSAQIEAVGLAPRAQWLIADGQLEGYEAWWQQANSRNLPYLPYRLTTYAGGQAPPPQRNIAEPAIQAVTLAAAAAKDDLHGTTNMPPVSLGQLDPHERSGIAIRALQGQAEVGSSGYLDNLASISMLYEGKILRDMIPRVYDRPGRIVPTMGADEKRKTVMVNIPFVEQQTPQGPKPQPVPPGTPDAQEINLKDAALSVTAVVGKSYATRREETADAISSIMQAAPGLAPILAPFWLAELDFPGAQKLAAVAKKTLPPQFQDEDAGGMQQQVAQMGQQLQQAQQMVQMLTQELQAKTRIIETDAVKAQADLQKTELELAAKHRTEVQLQEMKNAATLAVAHINAAAKGASLDAHAEEEVLALASQIHGAEQDRAHAMMAAAQAAQERQEMAAQQAQAPQEPTVG